MPGDVLHGKLSANDEGMWAAGEGAAAEMHYRSFACMRATLPCTAKEGMDKRQHGLNRFVTVGSFAHLRVIFTK